MTVTVRALRTEDRPGIEAFAHVRRIALPYLLFTPEAVAYDIAHAHPDAHYRALVAEEDGEVIGTAQTAVVHDSPEPGQGYVNVYVHPERTRRGAGALLVRTAERHLAAAGVTTSFSWVLDAPGNRAFAELHGYRSSRSAHFLRLDLANGKLPPLQDPRPASNSARLPTSPPTRARCSTWTRRRRWTNRAMWTTSSRTTRPGSARRGSTPCSATS